MKGEDVIEMTIRFDDICGNSSYKRDIELADFLKSKFPDARFIFGVSPLTFNDCGERIYPKHFNALSDQIPFFKPDKCWIPNNRPSYIELAGHGLWHQDHRLLTKELQIASILTSCSLVKAKIFIPPFGKWTGYMDEFCDSADIELIKFEDGWLSMEHEDFTTDNDKWYLHPRHWTVERLDNYITTGKRPEININL